jgi:uncharacterized protein (DUF1330 family)
VTDAAAYQQFLTQVPGTLALYNAHFLVRGAKAEVKEGVPPSGRVSIIAFDSMEDAEKWYTTPPYSELIPMRQRASTARIFIVEGVPQ